MMKTLCCEVSSCFYLAIFNLEVVNTFEVMKSSPSYTSLESVKSDLVKANKKNKTIKDGNIAP